ncbi:MAG: hypothetical protein AAGG01_23810, partial [Planctomycetota bacterium]
MTIPHVSKIEINYVQCDCTVEQDSFGNWRVSVSNCETTGHNHYEFKPMRPNGIKDTLSLTTTK